MLFSQYWTIQTLEGLQVESFHVVFCFPSDFWEKTVFRVRSKEKIRETQKKENKKRGPGESLGQGLRHRHIIF